MLINITQHPVRETLSPDERDFIGQLELDELDELDFPMSRDEAFRLLEGRVFEAVWPDDKFPETFY